MAEIKMTSKNEYVIVIPDDLDLDTITKVEIRGREFLSQPKIVRCKDCKWFKLSDDTTFLFHVCGKFSGVKGEYDFCSRGERREE